MIEGVSLAAMAETPVVIVVAQRPAPATGLPTRTEQADLELVLHAGHGEFSRAIFTPGTTGFTPWITPPLWRASLMSAQDAFLSTSAMPSARMVLL